MRLKILDNIQLRSFVMENTGFNINSYLVNGDPTGIIKCTISGRNSEFYKVPISEIGSEYIKSKDEFIQTCIYFLLGRHQQTNKKYIHIGLSDTQPTATHVVNSMIKADKKLPDIKYHEAIIVTLNKYRLSRDNLTYLKRQLILRIDETNRYNLDYKKDQPQTIISEEVASDIASIVHFITSIFGLLGYKYFVSNEDYYKEKQANIPQATKMISKNKHTETNEVSKNISKTNDRLNNQIPPEIANEEIYRLNDEDIRAYGFFKNNKFILLARSELRNINVHSMPRKAKYMRKQLKKENKLINFQLTEHITCQNDKEAILLIQGNNTSGKKWVPLENYDELKYLFQKTTHERKAEASRTRYESPKYSKKAINLYINRTRQHSKQVIRAQAVLKNEKYTVLAGSMIDPVNDPKLQDNIRELRAKAQRLGHIKNGKLTKNYTFNWPSSAASFVLGSGVHGHVAWKTKDGRTLNEVLNRKEKR